MTIHQFVLILSLFDCVLTGIPDMDELNMNDNILAYENFVKEAAGLIFKCCSPEGDIILTQTNRKIKGTIEYDLNFLLIYWNLTYLFNYFTIKLKVKNLVKHA